MDLLRIKADLMRKASQMGELKKKIPKYFAGAAEDMAHANFSAQGFVVDGSAAPKWKKRKKETSRTQGKRILSGTGYLEENVKAKALESHVKVGVDLSKVPYAQIHNEGGRLVLHVRAHHRSCELLSKFISLYSETTIDACKIAGLPEPELIEEDGGFMVTLFKDRFSEEQLQQLGLNKRQVKAVLYVKEKGKITNSEYQELNNVSRITATRDFSELVEKEMLKYSAQKGAGSFYILKK